MITFKTYLIESRAAPLYHATTMAAANKILKDNILYGTMQEGGLTRGQKVIFTTRSLKQAKHYVSYDQRYTGSVVFELDQEKLTHRYKVRPIKNWADDRADVAWDSKPQADAKKKHKPMYMFRTIGANEFEEIIIADKVVNISNYITKIYANRDVAGFEYIRKDDRLILEK